MSSLGIDVAKAKVDCCLLSSSSSKKPKHQSFTQSEKGYDQLRQWVKANGEALENLTIVLEATGVYDHKLRNWLFEQGAKVLRVQPTQARNFARYHKSNSKNDEIDSFMLAKMGQDQSLDLQAWKPFSPLYEELNALTSRLDQIVRMRSMEKNRLDGHDGMDALAEADMFTKEAIDFYSLQEKAILKKIDNLVKSDEKLRRDVALLKTVPCIGPKTAVVLAILFNTRNFKTSAQMANFIGLVPKEYKSGSSVNAPSRMSKKGSSSIRRLLYMCAFSVARTKSKIQRFYNNLLDAGKSKRCALGAVMHKIALIAFAVLKNGMEYNDNYGVERKQNASSPVVDPVGSDDSPGSERMRALRPSRTLNEEHKQDEEVKAAQSAPRRGCLDFESLVLPCGRKDRGADAKKRGLSSP